MDVLERRAAITGQGLSAVGRRVARTALDLTIDAISAAIQDAGLSRDDIDGLASWPGYRTQPVGSSPVSIQELQNSFGFNLNWYAGGPEGPGQLASVINAAMAVATGQARHVVCFRTLTEASSQTRAVRASVLQPNAENRCDETWQWHLPFNALSAANWSAMFAQRHMHEYGTTREQLAQIALNARRHAGLNPDAIYREPLTLDDYLNARMISTPLCLYDCDVPIDGACAVIVSRLEDARRLRKAPLRIEAMSGALHGRNSWDQFDDLTSMAARDASAVMWSRTDLKPTDVDVAQLYDGFSIHTMIWLEAMGFCGKGESGQFVEGGKRIGIDGELPLNTGGGQLSAGRLHGFGLLREGCIQLWREAGARQVPGSPSVAVVGVGGGPLASCILLVRE